MSTPSMLNPDASIHPCPTIEPYPIVKVGDAGDEVLRQMCAPIATVTDEHRLIAERMIETVRVHGGHGIAVPQIGLPLRMFVTGGRTLTPRVFINPEFVSLTGPRRLEVEGCLSCPGREKGKFRYTHAEIRFLNELGEEERLHSTSELEARCWQHEMDHLNGRLIIDGNA